MDHYQPSFVAKDTAQNITNFVEVNKNEFWKIFKPLMPFIAGCYILDAVISDLFFADSEDGFGLFAIFASYFLTVLVITWHRVVIHGPDNYIPMNPFKPKRHELVFIGVGFLLGLVMGLIGAGVVIGAAVTASPVMIIIAVIVVLAMIYILYRVCFYFPAKAVDASITLSQAFVLTKGYLWKIISATFRASFKLILLLIAFVIVAAICVFVLVMFLPLSGMPMVLGLIVDLPMQLYFGPLLTIIGVTALSNYYLYAIQNEERAVEG